MPTSPEHYIDFNRYNSTNTTLCQHHQNTIQTSIGITAPIYQHLLSIYQTLVQFRANRSLFFSSINAYLLSKKLLGAHSHESTTPESTHHRGKYRCTADHLLFDRFGLDQTSKTLVHATHAKQLNTNKINRRSAVQ